MNSENSTFHFQKFSLQQAKSAMKVGTDGVILGAWANASEATRLLDIGSGTGILTLMMAQRFPALSITAIEPDQGAFSDLSENIRNSPFSTRISYVNSRIQDFTIGRFDFLISNPPYFESGISAQGPRGLARHTSDLSVKDLVEHAIRLLNSHGTLAVVVPFDSSIISVALKAGLFLKRQCIVYSDENEPPIRRLLEFSFGLEPINHEQIYIRRNGSYSAAYLDLTREFYLDLK